MPELFVYLLKVNLAIVLFYLVYHFLLRRLTFYTLNRYYLLFAFVFSAFYPLVNFREWFASRQTVPEVIYYIAPDWTAVESSSFSIWPYLLSLFWAVVLFFLGRLALRLFSLWQIHRTSVPARWQYFHFRHVMQKINPFSFWKNIYVHIEAHQDDELMEIFNHEQVHVEQLHTVDTLLAEFFSILCWFNPATWLMRYAVRENLEFITDRRVLRSGVDKRAYQYSLLHLGTSGQSAATVAGNLSADSFSSPDQLVSHFNFKHLKTRIMMMNKKQSSLTHLGKYVLAVPVVVLLALVMTVGRTYVNAAETEIVPSEMEIAFFETEVGPTERNVELNAVPSEREELRLVDVHYLERKLPDDAVAVADTGGKQIKTRIILQGKQVVMGNPLRSGENVAVNADSLRFDAKENKVVIVGKGELFRKDSISIGDLIDAMEVGRKAIGGEPHRVVAVRSSEPLIVQGYAIRTTTSEEIPYVLIDGKKGELNQIAPHSIESIEVIKGDTAVQKYGSEAKNGVIRIKTKQ